MLFLISIVLEIFNVTLEEELFKNAILVTIINWSTCVIFVLMSFCVRKALWVQKLVCPFLTVYIFLVVIQSDPSVDINSAILFAKAMLGSQAVLYVLVMFGESWLVNTGIFTICAGMCMLRV